MILIFGGSESFFWVVILIFSGSDWTPQDLELSGALEYKDYRNYDPKLFLKDIS